MGLDYDEELRQSREEMKAIRDKIWLEVTELHDEVFLFGCGVGIQMEEWMKKKRQLNEIDIYLGDEESNKFKVLLSEIFKQVKGKEQIENKFPHLDAESQRMRSSKSLSGIGGSGQDMKVIL